MQSGALIAYFVIAIFSPLSSIGCEIWVNSQSQPFVLSFGREILHVICGLASVYTLIYWRSLCLVELRCMKQKWRLRMAAQTPFKPGLSKEISNKEITQMSMQEFVVRGILDMPDGVDMNDYVKAVEDEYKRRLLSEIRGDPRVEMDWLTSRVKSKIRSRVYVGIAQ